MEIRAIIPRQSLAWPTSVLLGAGLAVLALALRALLMPVLLSDTPYVTCFAAVLAATLWGGRIGGFACVAVSGFGANWMIPGAHAALALAPAHLAGLATFFLMATVMVVIVEAVTAASRRETALNAKLELMARELEHRAKNGLTVMQALIQQTGRHASGVEDFQAKLLDRLHALARAQGLVDRLAGTPAPLRSLVGEILGPFDLGGRITGSMAGDDVPVGGGTLLSLTLALHELATNATKYGALSTPDGKVSLSWTHSGGVVGMVWAESGGPPVATPSREGFGSRLFRTLFSPGKVEQHFEPGGVRCTLEFPAS